MPVGWGGADPTVVADNADYELGTCYQAAQDVTLTKVRVWADATSNTYTGREGRIWSTAGVLLATATLPTTLPAGWSSYDLDTQVIRTVGERWVVSYSSGGRYGAIPGALTTNVNSSDGAVIALATATAPNGNGIFNETPELYPTTTFGATFYGADVEYSLGAGGTPTITGVQLSATGLDVAATIQATDPDTLVGATYSIEWGDGDIDTGSSATFNHTYTTGGIKAILAKVTDNTSLSDYASAAIELVAPGAGLGVRNILDKIVSYALASGYFDSVNNYEPSQVPGHGLHSAISLNGIMPLREHSGLIQTSVRVEISQFIYFGMEQEPPDDIESTMAEVADVMIATYSGDFELGGNVKCIDLLGMAGTPLSAMAGYINTPGYANVVQYRDQTGTDIRIVNITIPVIVNDVWSQAA